MPSELVEIVGNHPFIMRSTSTDSLPFVCLNPLSRYHCVTIGDSDPSRHLHLLPQVILNIAFHSVFLAELFLSLTFFSTQPAPHKAGVIPAVLPVKGL